MSETSEAALNRIRGLLAKAEATEYPEEAEAFTAKAQELMAKYGVEQTALLMSDPTANVVGDRIVTCEAPYAMGKLFLLNGIAKALGVRTVRRTAPRNGSQELHLFGLASDLERVDILFTSLLLQAARLLEQDKVRSSAFYRSPKSWTRDWQEGYADRVWTRLAEAERRARVEQPTVGGVSTALVFVRRDELVNEAVTEKYPALRSTKNYRNRGSGYGSGDAAGARADLGGTKIHGGSAQALRA